MPPISAPAVIYQDAERKREGIAPTIIWRGTEWDGDWIWTAFMGDEAKAIRAASGSSFGRTVRGQWRELSSADVRGALWIAGRAITDRIVEVRGPAAEVLSHMDW
jgi:hypothetical protein